MDNSGLGAQSSQGWRFNTVCCLHWRQWQSTDSILYNDASGQTHFLNDLGACALRLLEATPDKAFTSLEIVTHVSERCEIAADAEFSSYIEQTLISMDELGLIDRRP